MKNNLYENFEERELRKIQAECDRYGYHAFLQFDEIHIRTKGEEWYFVPANIHGGMITLMHRSSGIQDKYHRQFQRQLDGKAYLRVDCNNPIFQKAFRSLEDVSVSAVECQDPKNAKNILWQKLCKRYEEMLPLSKNLTTELYPDWEHMTYPDVNSRCEDFARQNIANSYLTHLNAGQQMIPPHLLMPYVEESINYLQSEYGKNEYREKVQFLKKVFIDLNADDSIVRNIQPQFKTEEEPVINENTETDLEK